MSKSLVHSLEGYVEAIFKDIAPTYRSASDWERDKQRSLHELAVRGERFLTIDLPAIRKHFEKCLEEQLYTQCGLYLTARVSKRVVVPSFLKDLYLQVFFEDGKLRSAPNVCAIADLRQLLECFGKLKHPCKQRYIDNEVQTFINNERGLRSPSLDWLSDHLYLTDTELYSNSFRDLRLGKQSESFWPLGESQWDASHEHHILQKVCDTMIAQLGDFHDERPTELPQHGHGRVSNLKRSHSKYDFSVWPQKLDHIFPFDRYAVPNSGDIMLSDSLQNVQNHEHPSKLIAVPKTMSGPRLIASEPNYHQWIQQLVLNQIESRYKSTDFANCLSLDNQEPNQRMALLGSKNQSVSTVDLKSASDKLSCWVVERALRGNKTFLDRIHASRTRMIRDSASSNSFGTIVLKKCFTQGNACTFPVQSLVYSMLAVAAVIITDNKVPTSRNITLASHDVRVFGDDIIVPTKALQKLTDILTALQLEVNLSKTFSKGKFRESCGLDAYDGVNVTPARIKRLSESPSHEVVQSMLESSNNLFRRGMWNTANWLLSLINQYDFPVTQVKEGQPHDSSSLISYSGSNTNHLKKRWNPMLHRVEFRSHRLKSKSKPIATQSAHDLSHFLWKKARRTFNRLSYLTESSESSIGVVDKKAAVMQRGWSPLQDSHLSFKDMRADPVWMIW